MGDGSIDSVTGVIALLGHVALGGSEGGYSLETVEERGRDMERRRVEAVEGASVPVVTL